MIEWLLLLYVRIPVTVWLPLSSASVVRGILWQENKELSCTLELVLSFLLLFSILCITLITLFVVSEVRWRLPSIIIVISEYFLVYVGSVCIYFHCVHVVGITASAVDYLMRQLNVMMIILSRSGCGCLLCVLNDAYQIFNFLDAQICSTTQIRCLNCSCWCLKILLHFQALASWPIGSRKKIAWKHCCFLFRFPTY